MTLLLNIPVLRLHAKMFINAGLFFKLRNSLNFCVNLYLHLCRARKKLFLIPVRNLEANSILFPKLFFRKNASSLFTYIFWITATNRQNQTKICRTGITPFRNFFAVLVSTLRRN